MAKLVGLKTESVTTVANERMFKKTLPGKCLLNVTVGNKIIWAVLFDIILNFR